MIPESANHGLTQFAAVGTAPNIDSPQLIVNKDLDEQHFGATVNGKCFNDSDLQSVSRDDVNLQRLISVCEMVPTNIRAAILILAKH